MSSPPPAAPARDRARAPATGRAAAKARTHARIVAAASGLIRRRGLGAATVERVMRGAGLTVGGFYAHFRSKSAMNAEALRASLAEQRASWFAGLDDSEGVAWLTRAVKRYLAPHHRDRVTDGCPIPAVISELPRADKATRDQLVDAFELAVADFAAHAPATARASSRERALATLALCVGGLTLARALRGHAVSDELLRACVAWALPDAPARR